MDEHQLISAVKELALELGQTPTVGQFRKFVKSGQIAIENSSFRTYSKLLEAAGLAPSRISRVTNAIFEKNIDRHLEEYKSKEIRPREPWPKIAILGDLHEPFGSDRVKADFCSFVDRFKPAYIVQMGDLLDMYSHSKFPKSQNVFTPKDEETAAIKRVRELWSNIQKAAPDAKCIGLLGNHDLRPLKRVLESMPQMEHWAEAYFKDLMSFDNVQMILDPRQEFIISDIAFIHGYLGSLGQHRDYMMMNTVRAHDHVGGAVFRKIHGKTLWELDAGFAGEYDSKGFSYTNQKMTKTTEGFASIDELGPRFIPL